MGTVMKGSTPIVVIDARMAGSIEHGIAKYVALLAQGLSLKNRAAPLPYRPVFLVNEGPKFFDFDTYPIQAKFLNRGELFEIPKALKKIGAAAYHSPSFASLWSCPCPHLITIHDLIHMKFGNLAQKLYYQILLKRFAKKAASIITVSRSSQFELATWLDILPNKIEVVWNALELETPPSSARANSLLGALRLTPKKYFLCLGNLKPHKNIDLLLAAYIEFRKRSLERGQTPWPLALTLDRLPSGKTLEGVLTLGKLPAPDAFLLLTQTGGLLSPSLVEGFGLPPIEGATAGIRLAVSDIAPHREGLADLGPDEVFWAPAQDFQSWVEAFDQLQQEKVAIPSAANQKKIRDRFSVQGIGEHMDRIYTSVLGMNSS